MESIRHKDVKPLPGAAPYIGGKRNLVKRLAGRIEKIPHTCYAEPFLGMGGVFFGRHHSPKSEVVNDYNGEVANFFRVLQRHFAAFVDELNWRVASREEFERLQMTPPGTLTDIERAARFYYLQKLAFSGKVTGRTYGVGPGAGKDFNTRRLESHLEALHARLSGVVIECLPYHEFIPRYDRSGTLFYIAPPYYGHEGTYGKGLFGRNDFERMASLLKRIKGRFVLSLNDLSQTRNIFSAFRVERIRTTYTAPEKKSKPARELIISGPL